ncbi:hypothetical protein [Mesorhizobium sp. NZP2077]|nr:hypothetical protein [Mesorhizobium sp. NZP2077]
MRLSAKSGRQLVGRIARGAHLIGAEKREIDRRLETLRICEQFFGGRFGKHIPARAQVLSEKPRCRVSIFYADVPVANPHPAKECFQFDNVGVSRDPSVIGQHGPCVMAENNVVLEHDAIPVGAIRDDLPATTMTEKAADFRVGERRRDKRNPSGRIDTGNAFKSNANARKFHCDGGKSID